jgi:membrane dipeptidase
VLWVLLTLAAATLQATRNALSRQLVGRVSPALTAWSRFAFHLPFATALAGALAWREGWPAPTPAFFAWAAGGAVAQVLGNVALVAAFQVASFSQSVALHKLEVVFGALLGLALFGEVPSALGWGGILLSTAGVLLMNLARPGASGGWLRAFQFDRGTLYALLCGVCFALASFLFKEAIEALLARNPWLGPGRFQPAAHTVFHVAWIQVAVMTPAVAWMRPGELARVGALWRSMLGIGLSGFLGTLCWFWAFGLTLVAYVRAVGQVEAAISIAIAALVFREAGLRRQLPAIAAIVAGVGLVLLGCGPKPAPPAPPDPELAARAAALHRDALVMDGHNDVPTWILDYGFDLAMDGGDPRKRPAALYWVLGWALPAPRGEQLATHTDLARLRAGGVDAQWLSIWAHDDYVPRGPHEAGRATGRAMAMLAAVEEQLRRHPEALALARSAAEVRAAAAAGRIAVLLGLEGGHALEGSLDTLRAFHARGVRYVTLTWSNTNEWADSSGDAARHGGLGARGVELVREMNRLGMLVDVSHVSDETFWDVLETTRAPVIASHSSARAIADHPRNLSDEMLRAVAANGGVVMVNFGDLFLDPHKTSRLELAARWIAGLGRPRTPLALLADHVEHVARVAGADHVGLGSDFDGVPWLPEGMEDVSCFPNLTLELLRRGWSEADLRRLLGENALRVMAAAEAAAAAAPEQAAPERATRRPGGG